MVAKLATVKKERNVAVLKVIEKEGTIGRLSEQLQSECQSLAPSSFSPRARHDLLSLLVFQRSRPSWSNLECPRIGHCRPEPGPGCSAQVGGHRRDGHWRHCEAWEGDELGHGWARCVAWADDARDAD
jgi:hypothetical protein